jgi:hypothetical protein
MGPASSVRSRPPKQVEVLWSSPIQKAGSFSKPEGVVGRDGEHALLAATLQFTMPSLC